MTYKDLKNNIDVDKVIDPVVITDNTASVGSIIDTKGFGSVTFVIAVGTLSDSDATLTVSIDDGDDASLSDAAAVDDAFLIGTEDLASFTFADDGEVRWIGYSGKKRYVRLTLTPADNTGNIPVSAVAVKAHPESVPTTLDS